MKPFDFDFFRAFSRLSRLAFFLIAAAAYGHGVPIAIELDPTLSTVVASGDGFSAPGYAEQIVINTGEEAYFEELGNVLLTDMPGVLMRELTTGSAVRLEPLPRRAVGSMTNPLRWLWYWNESTNQVTSVPNNLALTIESTRALGSISFGESTGPATPGVLIANLLGSDNGLHQHLLYYELPNDPSTEPGIYGFFARITVTGKAPSNAVLVVLNHGLDPATAPALGAAAINLAAGLAGDYNNNGAIDAADYTVWRDSLGQTGAHLLADGDLSGGVTAADLAVWQNRFAAGLPAASRAVPEPAGLSLLLAYAAGAVSHFFNSPPNVGIVTYSLLQRGSLPTSHSPFSRLPPPQCSQRTCWRCGLRDVHHRHSRLRLRAAETSDLAMRILRKHHRTDANRRGTTAVELAFVLPVFLFLVLSIIEFAHAQMIGNVLRAACRTSARLGSTGGNSSAQVESHVRQVLSSAVRTAAINVFVKDASEFDAGGLPPANQSQFEAMPAIELADAEPRQLFLVRARVNYNDVALVPMPFMNGVILQGQAIMRHE